MVPKQRVEGGPESWFVEYIPIFYNSPPNRTNVVPYPSMGSLLTLPRMNNIH